MNNAKLYLISMLIFVKGFSLGLLLLDVYLFRTLQMEEKFRKDGSFPLRIMDLNEIAFQMKLFIFFICFWRLPLRSMGAKMCILPIHPRETNSHFWGCCLAILSFTIRASRHSPLMTRPGRHGPGKLYGPCPLL